MNNALSLPYVHLVGSANAPTRRAAMEKYGTLWRYLRAVPEGDTSFPGWIMPRLRSTFALPGMTKLDDGSLELGYTGMPTYTYRDDRELEIPAVLLGYYDQAAAALPILTELATSHGEDKPYQACIIDPYDHAFFALGSDGLERHYESFRAPVLSEIAAIQSLFGDNVVYQLESPARLLTVEGIATTAERATKAAELADDLAKLVRRMPDGARVVIHLCRGDWEHRSWMNRINGLEPVVQLANAIVAAWPAGHILEGIHIPLAAADVLPADDDGEFYRPLADLTTGTRIYAGIAHENATAERTYEALRLARRFYPAPFSGLGTSCGMARMSEPEMDRTLELLAQLMRMVTDQSAGAKDAADS